MLYSLCFIPKYANIRNTELLDVQGQEAGRFEGSSSDPNSITLVLTWSIYCSSIAAEYT